MKKLFLTVAVCALGIVPSALAGVPVPSLTPGATHKLWQAEVARAKAHPRALADASCRPARAMFYAQTDWLRLATKLAQQPSACAQYFVSVPPLAADKSQARPNQAAQIRALGPSFHALDEISWNGWSAWISANNSTWYDAGVIARQRMAAAGFDAAAGDTWALNELSSAVRTGTGAARQNALEFMRGLASDGVKGAVFVAGIGQTTSDTSLYKVNLQNWLLDSAFWASASSYTSDWAQENYGDVRAYAVAGSSPEARRDAELQYLGHELTLANAGPGEAATARGFLQSSYVSFGNAAWAWASAYGWTSVPFATMQDFVSGQVYAARSLGAPSGVDRLGFAWAPNNSQGLATTDFNAQTAAILDRIAGAIHDTDTSADAACAPSWCSTTLDGAAFTNAWQGFSTWSQPGLALTSAPATFAAGASVPLTVQIQTAGVPQNASSDQNVSFTTTSGAGGFSTAAGGPASQALTAAIPAGASSVTVYYTDTAAGSPTVSAALPGQAAVAQAETVTASGLARLMVTPATASIYTGAAVTLTATGADAYGNPVAAAPAWTLSTSAFGHLSATGGSSVVFTSSNKVGTTTVTATANGISARSTVTVAKRPAH